jgi:hypothetical protein
MKTTATDGRDLEPGASILRSKGNCMIDANKRKAVFRAGIKTGARASRERSTDPISLYLAEVRPSIRKEHDTLIHHIPWLRRTSIEVVRKDLGATDRGYAPTVRRYRSLPAAKLTQSTVCSAQVVAVLDKLVAAARLRAA